MAERLLDRQARLLEYLTSGDAIYRDGRDGPPDATLQGIDRALLHIEARFSHEKRMEKIAAVFPKTFAFLNADRNEIVREFVEACPPLDIGRLANARQFLAFLTGRWQYQPPTPPYLPDVLACELACAQVRIGANGGAATGPTSAGPPGMRRKPGVILLHTRFDIRPIFEDDRGSLDPIERKTALAIAGHAGEPRIFELTPELFDLLMALGEWTALDELPSMESLIADVVEAGLLEVRR